MLLTLHEHIIFLLLITASNFTRPQIYVVPWRKKIIKQCLFNMILKAVSSFSFHGSFKKDLHTLANSREVLRLHKAKLAIRPNYFWTEYNSNFQHLQTSLLKHQFTINNIYLFSFLQFRTDLQVHCFISLKWTPLILLISGLSNFHHKYLRFKSEFLKLKVFLFTQIR